MKPLKNREMKRNLAKKPTSTAFAFGPVFLVPSQINMISGRLYRELLVDKNEPPAYQLRHIRNSNTKTQ